MTQSIQLQSYADFSQELHKLVWANRVPVNGTIEVSRRCPLTCAHCYNNLPMNDPQARAGELTLEEHCRILDEITEAGCLWLLYTGGEIFARRDFLQIYTYARQKGLILTLFTNGTLVTPRVADALARQQPFAIEITLYGRTRETYESLTGIPGSYEKCMRGIRLLKERDLPLKLKTVGVIINKHEVWDMKRFAEEELGVEFKFDSMINPRIDCSRSPLQVRLRPADIVEFDLRDSARLSEWKGFAERFTGLPHAAGSRDEVYQCGGGVNSFAIDPLGKMSICVLSHFDAYDLRQGNFRQGWENFLLKVRHKKIKRITKCTDCQIKAMCGMCPANGELENGDADAPVDFLCHVAHLRAAALGITVPSHGNCDYCAGGTRYLELMESISVLESRIGETGQFEIESSPLPPGDLPLSAVGCGSGGCSSCSSGVVSQSWEV